MTTPLSKNKTADSRQPPPGDTPSEIKFVETVRNQLDAQPLKAADLAAGTPASTLPSVDMLTDDSDVSAFMSADIAEDLRQTALRQLFLLPKFNRRDGLDDYDNDYRAFKPLGDILTSDRRHQLERITRGGNTDKQQFADSAAQATAGLGADAGYRQHHERPGRTPSIGTQCILCHRPNLYTNKTSAPAHCAQWFEQCPSRADAGMSDSAQAAMEFDCQTQSSSAWGQAEASPSDVQAGGLSHALHAAINVRIESGQENPVVVFGDAGLPVPLRPDGVPDVPEGILWFPLSNNGLMLDIGLAALAWGAHRVVVVVGDGKEGVWSRLDDQIAAARAILVGLGLEKERIGLVRQTHFDSAWLSALVATPTVLQRPRPALFAPVECGRAMVYSAVDALLAQISPVQPAAGLPEGSPFGAIHIDSDACTLCMACVAACPSEALRESGQTPQILFQEARCVQCGLCQAACPENAIEQVPQMTFDRRARCAVRCLHQAEPIGCVVCGRPFAIAAMVDRVAQRLANHWMYQSDAAKRRLRMCRDCRVQDFIRDNGRPD